MVTEDLHVADGESIGVWLGRLSAAIAKGLGRELRPYGITAAQWPLLNLCHRKKIVTPSEMARVVPIDLSAITRQLDKLERKGLIQRHHSTTDRRYVEISLTAKGRELVPTLYPCTQRNISRFLLPLSETETTEFIASIQKMLAASADERATSTAASAKRSLNTQNR